MEPTVTIGPAGIAWTDSRHVADYHEKEHRNVLRDIDSLLQRLAEIHRSDLSHEHFQEVSYFCLWSPRNPSSP